MDYNPVGSKFDRDLIGTMNYPSYSERSENNASSYEHTFQADYFEPINKTHQIEGGVKYILRPNSSETDNYRRDTGSDQWIAEDVKKNDLDYRQHIAAGNVSYQVKFTPKLSLKLGARAEYTINDGTFMSKGGDHKLDNNYFDLTPSATFAWQPTEKQGFRVDYTQRLSRPGIWYLNPYVNDMNPSSIQTGNPELDSEISNNFNVTYNNFTQKFNISVSLNSRMVDNAIETVTSVLPNGALSSTYDNIGESRYYGLYLYGSLRLLQDKLNFSFNGGAGYTTIQANNGSGLSNEGWNGNGNFSINYKPWKHGSVYAHVGFWTGNIALQNDYSGYWYHTIGMSQGFLNTKLRMSLSVRNPFEKEVNNTSYKFGPNFKETMH